MNMNLGILKITLIFLFSSALILLSFSSKSEPIEGLSVEIKILDKITAKIQTFEIDINDYLKFGSLKIYVYKCFKNPPEEIPEDFMLLKIYDNIDYIDQELLYQGWMISSSPESTPLEHPIYDLWINDCKVENDF